MAKEQVIPRPIKRSEYTIICSSRTAQKGWRDLLGTQRNALAETWDFLTTAAAGTVAPAAVPQRLAGVGHAIGTPGSGLLQPAPSSPCS